jgi:hypothetical protein
MIPRSIGAPSFRRSHQATYRTLIETPARDCPETHLHSAQ